MHSVAFQKREHEREKEKGPQIEVGQQKKEQKEERKKLKKFTPKLIYSIATLKCVFVRKQKGRAFLASAKQTKGSKESQRRD